VAFVIPLSFDTENVFLTKIICANKTISPRFVVSNLFVAMLRVNRKTSALYENYSKNKEKTGYYKFDAIKGTTN